MYSNYVKSFLKRKFYCFVIMQNIAYFQGCPIDRKSFTHKVFIQLQSSSPSKFFIIITYVYGFVTTYVIYFPSFTQTSPSADIVSFDLFCSIYMRTLYNSNNNVYCACTVLLKDNIANACNFFAIYECILSLSSAFRVC